MPIIQLNLTPSRQDLQWFAGLWWPTMCVGVGLMLIRKFHLPSAAISIWAVGGALAAAGVIAPAVIRPLYLALMRLTYPIGWWVSHVILAVLYFGVLTPVGLLLRLSHDPMTRKFERGEKTYWTARDVPAGDRYFKQL